ncbi:MAG: cation:proton antiporter [Gammaproteobacteria bacterium]|nr:cation:proton antiporter [Gammaproteobacteria bacterium]MBT8107634.1 cation:proton antiporter [Gammaproteobacteria bacterium]NNF50176.1 cation:proton antiporter [Woeseiaceae bacterium]
MDILYLILVLLVVTRVFAEVAERANVPAIVGELTAGVVLGLLLGTFRDSAPVLWEATQSETFESLVSLGMFFLMLLAGVRMEPLDFARTSKTAIFVAIGGMAVPVGAGLALGAVVLPESPIKLVQSLFLGVALAITAVPVAVRIFLDVGLLESRVGKTVIAAALWDDLISLFLLALLIAAIANGELAGFSGADALTLVGKVALFFTVTIPVGLWVFPIMGRYFRYLRFPEIDFSMLLIAALAYATFAERMDLHFIIGAFLAGMFFHPGIIPADIFDRVEKQMSGITRGFLAPLFFVSVGLHLDFSAIGSTPGFVVVLILVALFSKFIGAGLPAYWVGLSRNEALMVGVGMSGRGAVELIVAGVALQAGLFLHPSPPPPIIASMYSAVVIMALVTTVLTPLILRRLVDSNRA